MNWIRRYQLFLFDFDGLLVNTEHLHYKAYRRMCANRNIDLTWDFLEYAELAHRSATGVRDRLYQNFPQLATEAPEWSVLYEEKKQAFLQLLEEGQAELMPGVESLLKVLQDTGINRCVVTHSSLSLISMIRRSHPILDTIPYWITREDYSKPKPHSECYRVAIARLAKATDRIIGFEDSPRGLNALTGTRALPVLVCPPEYPYVQTVKESAYKYYPNFTAITENNCP